MDGQQQALRKCYATTMKEPEVVCTIRDESEPRPSASRTTPEEDPSTNIPYVLVE